MNAIFQKLIARLTAFFKAKAVPKVEDILSEVTSTVKRLEAAAQAHVVEAAKHAEAIVVAEAKKLESEAQTKLANTVANNIKALLTPRG